MIVELIIGMLAGITLFYMIVCLWDVYRSAKLNLVMDDPTDDAKFDQLQHTPHCPYCGSYELKLIDDNEQLPWLKGHIQELDHYRCQKCYETFSDENWEDMKVYQDQPKGDD